MPSYRTSFQGDCSPNDSWASPALAFIPNLLRFTQSLRRYHDSGLYIHLVNAGKYSVSAAQIWVYFTWRILRRSAAAPTLTIAERIRQEPGQSALDRRLDHQLVLHDGLGPENGCVPYRIDRV